MTIKLPEPVPFMRADGQHVYTHTQLVQAVRDALGEAQDKVRIHMLGLAVVSTQRVVNAIEALKETVK